MKKIESFQGLRGIAIVAIFIQHTEIISENPLGAWGVSIFFILSGFLMAYNYLQRASDPDFGFGFAWKKIRKLYPLHVFMMLIALFYELIVGNKDITDILIALLLHTLLIQSWSPYPVYITALNGVSWYLSASLFLYLCFPLILKLLRTIDNSPSGQSRNIVKLYAGGGYSDRDLFCCSCRTLFQ